MNRFATAAGGDAKGNGMRVSAESETGERDRQRVAMLLHGAYPMDERVKREAEALTAAGYDVDVVCLKQHPAEDPEEIIEGVRVIRVPIGRSRSDGRASYVIDYASSAVAFTLRLTALHMRHRYALVQVHTLPDALAFSALPAKLMGARLVLDIHDLMPELYMSKYELPSDGIVVRLLRTTERLATGLADHVVTASEAFRERLIERGVPSDKITVVLNTADPVFFPPSAAKPPRANGDFTVFWHGTMVDRYGVDLAIGACALARERIPGLRFVVYGFGECEVALRRLANDLGLSDTVEFRGHLNHTKLAPKIIEADVGIVPNRPDVHIDMAYPTKLFEFVQLGVPVVATRTRILERRFGERSLVFRDPTAESLADGLVWVHEHPLEARDRAAEAQAICEPIAWEKVSVGYASCIATTLRRTVAAESAE